jgi:hypothetical protein
MLIDSLYGMTTPKPSKDFQKKLQAAIEYLGDKYLLAKQIQKKDEKK